MTAKIRIASILLLAGLAGGAQAQSNFDDVVIESVPLTDSIAMLTGRGGNMAVSHGADGVVLVDDQFAPLSARIAAAVAEIDGRPIRFVVNTHWHRDHSGGNENFRVAGATIVAHDEVRAEMIRRWFKDADGGFVSGGALPAVTFRDRLSFHLNGETIEIFKVPAGHTGGDAFVHFTGSDVLHMGDVFFNGLYSFFDRSSGGRFDGMIEGLALGLEIAGPDTRIIPGHGPLAARADLADHLARMRAIRALTAEAIAQGVSKEDFIAAEPTADLEAAFTGNYKVMAADKFLALVYDDLAAER